jgi:signal transduction histidine kinase
MNKKKNEERVKKSMFSIWNFIIFFLTISFVVTASFYMFLKTWGIEIGMEIQRSAFLTFINILILSFIFTLIDGIRRKMTVERPLKRILTATSKWTPGNFTERIEPIHGIGSMNEFDIIIMDLNKMAGELSGIETLRTDFIANVSHELKTPLAVIQNYATMLQNPVLTEEKRIEYAKSITDGSRRFSELVTNILKLNKLENQQIYPETREYNLSEQLRESLLDFEDAWDKKNLELDVDGIDDDIKIQADAELLTLVWNNLFSNAVKFSEDGGKIFISLENENSYAVAKRSDTGCGMPPEVGQRIFEKFYQGDNSHSTQGNGLGLALVKRVIDILGGEISVESTLGKGSTFIVKLKGNAE